MIYQNKVIFHLNGGLKADRPGYKTTPGRTPPNPVRPRKSQISEFFNYSEIFLCS